MSLNDICGKHYFCNFNDTCNLNDLNDEDLRRVWECNWTVGRVKNILKQWQHHSKEQMELNNETAKQFLLNAIELILIFVQNNFTGPFTQLEEFSEMLLEKSFMDFKPFKKLMENGEEINSNVKLGELLLVAKEILQQLILLWPDSLILNLWHLRLICIHQQIIDELTGNLYNQLKNVNEILLKSIHSLNNKELEAVLYLEIANSYLLFHRPQKADEILELLCSHLNVSLNIEGLLGVRTKFQTKPLPQLCLKVIQKDMGSLPNSKLTNGSKQIPPLLLLEDDTRLERIKFIEISDNEVMSLPSVLQGLVLAKVKLLKRSQPKDRLADEELEPYIQTLLYQEFGPLQIRQSALLLNCIQESTQRRTVERSWKQCTEAVKLLFDTKYSFQDRLSYGFASFLQPHWQIQMQLCDLLLSLGMTKTALDIYLKIEAWQEVIQCYTRLELRHKAAEIIKIELEKKPTVLLHCLLGDATDDPMCYETAWEFSNQTSGKAQAHWGTYYFKRAEYVKAIPHLKKSTEINPLQEKIWLRLGYAAIMLENWELAVHAYITYTHLEPLGFESWNNLAKALIKLGDKKRAHKVLGESLKCNFHNWKVWENFMIVSVDTGHYEDAINAYNRLSELKDRYIDLEVLWITIKAIADGKSDAKGQTHDRLLKKATSLMGYQCIKHGNEPKVWELAALLATTPLNKAQKLVKSFRAHTAKESNWASKQPFSLKAIQLCRQLCEYSLAAITNHNENETEIMITSQLNSARLSTQACVRSMENENEKWDENQKELNNVKELLEQIIDKIKERMNIS